MINYFILSYRGFDLFENGYKKDNFNDIRLRIIDNGDQDIKNFETYVPNKNLGCAGGWNLICQIAFEHFNLEKIIIGQDDTTIDSDELHEIYEKCNENRIVGIIKPYFEFCTFAISKKTFEKIGKFDENCISAYCEDADYKQRCYLDNVEILSLDKSLEKNLGVSRKRNKKIYDTITVNRAYIKKKWGNSINLDKIGFNDQQPPYEYKKPFNKENQKNSFIPMSERLKIIMEINDNNFPSETEFLKFIFDNQGIKS